MKKSYHSIIVPVAEPTITLNREFVPAKAVPGAEAVPDADWIAIDQRPREYPRSSTGEVSMRANWEDIFSTKVLAGHCECQVNLRSSKLIA
jgi:hypothetical protein